jgi:hypothetical protein
MNGGNGGREYNYGKRGIKYQCEKNGKVMGRSYQNANFATFLKYFANLETSFCLLIILTTNPISFFYFSLLTQSNTYNSITLLLQQIFP